MSKFLSYIHNLRGVAILFVVGVHARGGLQDWFSHPTAHKIMATLFDSQEGNGTVMFLFIAGFLFQHLTHNRFDFKKYINQKFKVIILPYLIISIPIIFFRISTNYQPWSAAEGFTSMSWAYQFLYHLVIGSHMAPFWFITAIIFFYISAPLLHKLDQPFFYRYIFPVVLLVGMFTYRAQFNGNPLLAYLHYLPIYLAGMWASYYKEKIFIMDLRYFWALCAVYLLICYFDMKGSFLLAENMTFEQVLQQGVLVFNVYILRALILCFMCAMLFYRLQFVKMPYLELLAEYSFGIFFVHFLLIIATRKVFSMILLSVDFSIVTFTAYYLFILLLSTMLVFLIKKLAGPYSRNLIGS